MSAAAPPPGPPPDARNATTLATRRLELSFGTPADAALLFPYVHGEAGRAVTDTLLWDGPAGVDEIAAFFRLHTEGTWVPHGFHWLLRDRTGALAGYAGAPLGSIGVRPTDVPHRCDVGYWLAPPLWGRGLMTEALGAVCAHAFDALDMAKVEATVFPENTRGLALPPRVGFRREGLLRAHCVKRGRLQDVVLFGLLRDELLRDAPGPTRAQRGRARQ